MTKRREIESLREVQRGNQRWWTTRQTLSDRGLEAPRKGP